MFEKIEKIKTKSEDTRKQILYISVFLIMSAVIAIWIYTLGYRFKTLKTKTEDQSPLSPFSAIGEFAKDTFSGIKTENK